MARAGRDTTEPLNPNWSIKRDVLNPDQRNAVRHVLESNDQTVMLVGDAGTGKTSLRQEVAEAITAGGHRLFAFAPSAEASRAVLRQEGFEATTVAELLISNGIGVRIG